MRPWIGRLFNRPATVRGNRWGNRARLGVEALEWRDVTAIEFGPRSRG